MATAHAAPGLSVLVNRGLAGIVGGLVGGVAFGILMQLTGMIPMVAMLVGSDSAPIGWLVHLFNSALFGAIFAVPFGRWAASLLPAAGIGLAYGVLWWVLGALLIMPAWLGMNEMIFELNTNAWRSLIGHLVYGLLLGLVYVLIGPRLRRG